MDFTISKLPVLPNSRIVALPTIPMILSPFNNYDVNFFKHLKEGDMIVISNSFMDNAYGDLDNVIFPGVQSTGCAVKITKIFEDDNQLKINAIGEYPVSLSSFNVDSETKIVYAATKPLPQKAREDSELYKEAGRFATVYSSFKKKYPQLPDLPDFVQIVPEIAKVPYQIAVFLNADLTILQNILNEADPVGRFRYCLRALEKYDIDSEVELDIKKRMDESAGKQQREYILRQKLKAVQEELKPFDGGDDIDRYLQESENESKYPEHVRNRIKTEIGHYQAGNPSSAESNVTLNYLDLLTSLPWNISTEDNTDLKEVKKVLDRNHDGLEKQKERILEYLTIRKLNKSNKGTILCFAGSPGVGKTSLGISIAEALNKKFIKFAMGGISDESEIRGHRKTYVGAMPGRIISLINKCGVNNPVFLLDEIDKIEGGGMHGNPAAALLEVLDPEQNIYFEDNYLDEPFDLSKVLFICTANDINHIPGPLRDRLEIIELDSYTPMEKVHIATTHLIPAEAKENCIADGQMEWTTDALYYIIDNYTFEAGVRSLRRKIAAIDRKFAVNHDMDPEKYPSLKVTVDVVKDYLRGDYEEIKPDVKGSEIGKINGLAWTGMGGTVLPIECVTYPGKGGLILTGKLGDVMQEASKTALSYIKSISSTLGIDPNFFELNDIHIHFPDTATPKDGPSAGAATALVILSAITKIPVKRSIALTGEIDLRGNVTAIGGLREKSNAAMRAHIKTIYIPKQNHKAFLELPSEITSAVKIKEASKLEELFCVFTEDILSMRDEIQKRTASKTESEVK